MQGNHQSEIIPFPTEVIREIGEMADIMKPCCVIGEYGKTVLLRQMYKDIKIYDSREILDVKNMAGFYAVQNNELKYITGVLVEAMVVGQVVCFKNIHFNTDLLHFLKPVINDRRITAMTGETIVAHRNFRLFFTATDPPEIKNCAVTGPIRFTYGEFLDSLHPDCREVVSDVLEFIRTNHSARCLKSVCLECEDVCLKHKPDCECYCVGSLCGDHFRMLCLFRDLIPSCQVSTGEKYRTMIYQGLVNVFLQHDSRRLCERLMLTMQPLVLPNMLFAKTAAAESAIKSLVFNIRNRQHTLLVGETGAGKTALVQYLCKNAEYFFGYRADLKTVNMSSDFDVTELIGGYHSIDFDRKIADLYARAKIKVPKSLKRRDVLQRLAQQATGTLLQEVKFYLKLLDEKVPFYFRDGILTDAMKNGGWVLLDEINLCSEETLNLIDAVLGKDEIVLFETGDSTPIKIHPSFMVFSCMNPHGDFGKKKYESASFNKIFFHDFSMQQRCIKAVVQSITRNMIGQTDQITNFYYEFKQLVARREYTNIVEPLVTGRTLCRALELIIENRKDENAIFKAFNLLFLTQLNLASRAHAVALYKKHFGSVPAIGNSSNDGDIDGFVVTPRVGIHIADVELAIQARLPVLLQGDTSTGKTSLIFALARKHGRKVLRINNHSQTESSDYIGSYTTVASGIEFRYGPLVHAMRSGYWIVLDELNLAPSDVLEVLNRLLDDNRELYVPETDEVVRPHTNFRIFATQNINYSGRNGLAKSFRNRFVEIFFYEKDDAEIKEILEKAYRMPACFIRYMVSVYNILKAERSLDSLVTLRDLFKWAQRMPGGYYELYEIGLDILLMRQRTRADREKIQCVFTAVFQDRFSIEKRNFEEAYRVSSDRSRTESMLYGIACRRLVLTRSYMRLIDLISKAWRNNEPVLLIGETGIGKTRICELVSAAFHVPLTTINVHGGTESADFVGHPVLDAGEVRWKNGPLLDAMVNGHSFLIDEINLADDSVLERLNSVLEDQRCLFVPEITMEVKADQSFKVIATMNPGGDFGKKELSPALRSRFTEIYFELESEEYQMIFDGMLDSIGVDAAAVKYFSANFHMIRDLSIRKLELVASHIEILAHNRNSRLGTIRGLDTVAEIWTDCLEMLGHPTQQVYSFEDDGVHFGVHPYFLKTASRAGQQYSFSCHTARLNLQRVIRGLAHEKGLLLQGEPGVGKTSILQCIAAELKIPILRINLSEQTEMSDLLGSYIPFSDTIRFVESELVKYLRQGYWIILDEINLCTQSVIEGLNSVLDHRRSIEVDGEQVGVHRDARVFGTMNPWNRENGRKRLPKSFIDRFIVITMDTYKVDDVKCILAARYGESFKFDEKLTLRGNIKLNELESGNADPDETLQMCMPTQDPCTYCFGTGHGRVGNVQFVFKSPSTDYVVPHSQIPQIGLFLKCMMKKIPVILVGDLGRNALLRFASSLLLLELVKIDCHRETDTCDLLGQYMKMEATDKGIALFQWRDSVLLKKLREPSLIAFDTPELVDKSVFDRLSSLFESERTLNVYEKSYDTVYSVEPKCRLVLCCDTPAKLSPALLDRCQIIELSGRYSHLDVYKLFCTLDSSNKLKQRKHGHISDSLFRDLIGSEMAAATDNLDLDTRRFTVLNRIPSYLLPPLGIGNTILEEQIHSVLCLPRASEVSIDASLLDAYKLVSSFAVRLPEKFRDSVELLCRKPNTVTLIKASISCTQPYITELQVEHENCKAMPTTLLDFKTRFLEDLRDKTIADSQDILYLSRNIRRLQPVEAVNFDRELFRRLVSVKDPLCLIRNEIENEKIRHENEIRARISSEAVMMYKYGRGNLQKHIDEFTEASRRYQQLISQIDRKLERNYPEFVVKLSSICFCDYVNDRALREFLEDFSDLSDYYLAHLYDNRHSCQRCQDRARDAIHTSRQCSLRLMRGIQTSEVCMKPEYSRFLYNRVMGIDQDCSGLVLEAFVANESLYHLTGGDGPEIHEYLEFNEDEIDCCIGKLVPRETQAIVLDNRKNRIVIGEDAIAILDPEGGSEVLSSVHCLSIFESPEGIINEMHATREKYDSLFSMPLSDKLAEYRNNVGKFNEILSFFTGLYKTASCFGIERNYICFQELRHVATAAELERYFLGCCVFEFLDRIYFAERILEKWFNMLLYNYVLLYRSFGFQAAYQERLVSARTKMKKDPRHHEDIINEFVGRFLLVHVLNLARIDFVPPGCQGDHPECSMGFLIDAIAPHTCSCDCSRWLALADSFSRDQIISSFHEKVTREDLMAAFMNRRVGTLFSTAECALAKTICNVMFNLNKMKYDEDHASAVINLCIAGVACPFPPYLYFVFKFSNSFAVSNDIEEGVGLHDGTGIENIEDKIDEDDVNDECQRESQENKEDDGQDVSNDGDVQSVEQEEDGESGVDDKDVDSGRESEDEMIEAGGMEEADMEDKSEEAVESSSTVCEESESTDRYDTEEGEIDGGDDDEACASEESRTVQHVYEWTEAALNATQTCTAAEGYSNKVEGGSIEEKEALKAGDGCELAEGEELAAQEGLERVLDVAIFPKTAQDCTRLTNLLRIILESNKNNKYKGDFKSGKKLNLKKLVPYIASDFRKDKIWMKRQKNEKKEYVLRIFIDNSKSMNNQKLVDKLSAIYYKLDSSFALLNIPVELYKFGSALKRCDVSELTFDEENTLINWTSEFKDGINIILTDGVFHSVGYAMSNFLVVMIDRGNIRKMSKVNLLENKVFIEKYLDSFALKYCIVDDIDDLEGVFVSALASVIAEVFQ